MRIHIIEFIMAEHSRWYADVKTNDNEKRAVQLRYVFNSTVRGKWPPNLLNDLSIIHQFLLPCINAMHIINTIYRNICLTVHRAPGSFSAFSSRFPGATRLPGIILERITSKARHRGDEETWFAIPFFKELMGSNLTSRIRNNRKWMCANPKRYKVYE
jgi:hypothetical protein